MAKYRYSTSMAVVKAFEKGDPNSLTQAVYHSVSQGTPLAETVLAAYQEALPSKINDWMQWNYNISGYDKTNGNAARFLGANGRSTMPGMAIGYQGTPNGPVITRDMNFSFCRAWIDEYSVYFEPFTTITYTAASEVHPSATAYPYNYKYTGFFGKGYLSGFELDLYGHFMGRIATERGWIPYSNKVGYYVASLGDVYLKKIEFSIKTSAMPPYIKERFLQPKTTVNAESGITPFRSRDFTRHTDCISYRTTGVDQVQCIITYTRNVDGSEVSFQETITGETISDYYHKYYMINRLIFLRDTDVYMWASAYERTDYPLTQALIQEDLLRRFFSTTWVNGEFLPITYFKIDNGIAGPDAAVDSWEEWAYNTQKYALDRFLGIDYDDVLEKILDNPDIADVDTAILMFGVPLLSEDSEDLKYIFRFIEKTHEFSTRRNAISVAENKWNGHWIPVYNDSMMLKYDAKGRAYYIYLEEEGTVMVNGTQSRVIGAVGDVIRETVGSNTFRFSKQINATQVRYFVVRNPRFEVSTEFTEQYVSSGEDSENIILPLDLFLLDEVVTNIQRREKVIINSMHFVFMAIARQKVKWYQSGIFKVFLTVISIGLAAFTLGSSLLAIGTAASLGGAALTSALVNIAINTAIAIGVNIAVGLVLSVAGLEAGFIISLLLLATAAISFASFQGLKGAPWAKDLLKLSNNFTESIGKSINKELELIQKSFIELEEERHDFQEELDRVNDLLGSPNIKINPLLFVGEKPEQYYNRTIHSGNIGLISLDAPHTYVSSMLKLPEPVETLTPKKNAWEIS